MPAGNLRRNILDAIDTYLSPRNLAEVSLVIESPVKRYASTTTSADNFANEVDRYLSLPIGLSNTKKEIWRYRVLLWRRNNLELFPTIAKLAQIVLAVPATSAEPGIWFSITRNLLREKLRYGPPVDEQNALYPR